MISRIELFENWFCWGVKYKDIDPAIWLTNYLNSRYEHNIEQKYWFCWLYANTYFLPSAWVLLNEFPDFELVTVDRLSKWLDKWEKDLFYQVDCKWNKGYLLPMFISYKNFIGERTQKEKFESLCKGDYYNNFDILYQEINKNIFKFGRYTIWFYLQHLKQTVGLNVEPSSLLFKDYTGSKSHRNGMLYALNLDNYIDKKLNKLQYDFLEKQATKILERCKLKFPKNKKYFDRFFMETSLCSFKKIFRRKNGRYLGYYLDRQAEEIIKTEKKNWYGIDWEVFWQARIETLNHDLLNNKINKNLFGYYLDNNSIYHNNLG